MTEAEDKHIEQQEGGTTDDEGKVRARVGAQRMLIVTLVVVTLAMLLMNRVSDALRPACVNTIVETLPSPDNAWNAILFERSCGATTGFTSQVSVMPSGRSLPDTAGNAFVSMRGDTAGTTTWGGPLVQLSWTGERQLEVSHDPTAHTMSSSNRVGEVSVSFVENQTGL